MSSILRAVLRARMVRAALLGLIVPWLSTGCGKSETKAGRSSALGAPAKTVIRVGHFPNITHAQGVIGHGLSRNQKGWFEERLGPGIEIEWFVYQAGPAAMEAMLAGSIDLSYVGPSPAVTAHLRTGGREIRIVAGACSGGAALVVREGSGIQKEQDFKGRKVATPQFGNTQDIAARTWLQSKGFRVTLGGGDVLVVPTANADQLAFFQQGTMDAAWSVEPWVTRLLLEGKGKIYLDESTLWNETGGKYVTTHLVSSVGFLTRHRDLLKKWILAQVELTDWILQKPEEAKQALNAELEKEVTKALPKDTLEAAWKRIEVTNDPIRASLLKSADDSFHVGVIQEKPDLSKIYELSILNEVLREKGRNEIGESAASAALSGRAR